MPITAIPLPSEGLRYLDVAEADDLTGTLPGLAAYRAADDAEKAVAIVPADVRRATLYQADSILAGEREPRIAAQHDGVVYELTGGLAESYKSTQGRGVPTGLCRRAWMLMRRYRLRSGRLA